MNLLYGVIVEIFQENGMRVGKVRVGGATKNIPLELLTDALPGDRVLICDGVAISMVAKSSEEEKNNVSGNSG